jgi:iron complex transport system substrate-binding protein
MFSFFKPLWNSRTGRKAFFFEKKKQKTFVSVDRCWRKVRDSEQTFFGSRRAGSAFFQKRTFFLFLFFPSFAFASGVVSLNLCTDQLLVLLAPERVAALEFLARDSALSFVAPQAARLPVVRADAEAVLRLRPDLVLAGRYGAQTTVALLRQRGVRVVQFDEPEDFAAIEAQVMRMALLLGEEARGAAMVARLKARLAALPSGRRGRAVFWEPGGWAAGPGSLADAVLTAAGWQDAGTGGRLGVEALLAVRPDVLVTDTPPAAPSMATDLAWHPALRGMARRTVDPALLICGGPFTVGAAESLAR